MAEIQITPVAARSSLETWQCDPKPVPRNWQTLAEVSGFVTVTLFIVAVMVTF